MQHVSRSVFGKPIKDVEVDWELIKGYRDHQNEDLFAQPGNGDPNFQYLWVVWEDPRTTRLIRKGLYEVVTVEHEPDLITAADTKDGFYKINELILARIPKDVWFNLEAANDQEALSRERNTRASFMSTVEKTSEGGAAPIHEITEKVERGMYIP